MPVLSVRGLTKRFGEAVALDDLSFEVGEGEIFGLIGPDGAGKTTTLRLLVGVMDAGGGRAIVAGHDAAAESEKVREEVGYMPQQFALYGDLTVAENLDFFADMYFVGKKERAERLRELYGFSRLEPFANRPAAALSGGMQKKLGLSCSMIHTPKLLLLDEPTTGVDPVSRRELWEILYRFAARGVAMIVSTPYMDEAERCHRVGLMHQGKFLVVDKPQAIIDGFENQIYELVCERIGEARSALDGKSFVEDVYPCGDALHISVKDSPDLRARLEETLRGAGVDCGGLVRVRPTFEDVFMTRIREAG